MRIVAISNQKGGVGKTTTAVNLAAALAEQGRRVLLIDLDPQGNASTHLGVDIYRLETSIYDVLTRGVELSQVLQPTSWDGLVCAPSNIDLSSAEIEMVSAVGRETILKEALVRLERDLAEKELPALDFVVIDCPPSLGLLSINALAAAREILVPMQTEFFALQGMSKLMEVVEVVQQRINPSLRLAGIVACRMDTRTRLASEVLEDIAAHFPEILYETRIRQNVKLAEAPSYGQTVLEYAPESKGAEDYRQLAREYLGLPLVIEEEDEEDELEDEFEEEDDAAANDEVFEEEEEEELVIEANNGDLPSAG
ncbi:MAG TPA: ParA family protein [Planctomycetes bacterium]|nr:ParA family protein [Planctomycetota bacterium]